MSNRALCSIYVFVCELSDRNHCDGPLFDQIAVLTNGVATLEPLILIHDYGTQTVSQDFIYLKSEYGLQDKLYRVVIISTVWMFACHINE